MESWLRSAVANAEPALERLITAPLPPKGQLSFATDFVQMARVADFIQENVPEQLELKQRVLGDISRHARPGVIIASSTSGLMPSDLQRSMQSPERFCVAHPFNPVYLLPLVEIVGGELTSAATLQVASDFFRFIGMHPLRVRKEIPGHLTDRLQEALWREILHMVNDGVATTGELDESIIYGPGLRWAGMGTNLIYHLAGGESGMRHMLEQFGPCLKWPWTKLEAPELTEALIDRMVEGTQQQAAGRSIRELERLRDDYLVAIQQVLRRYNVGAGATLRALEDRLFADASKAAQQLPHDQSGPTRVLATQVRPEWIDYNGHMTESRYLQVFGDATDALFVRLGADAAYRATGRSFFTVETHITHQLELNVSDSLYVTTQILGFDARRLHIFHRMHRAHDAALVATAEHMQLHVDSNAKRTAPMGPEVQAQVERLAAAHATLSPPPERGRTIGLKQVG
jgi:carnitine 3-dehydrogenase